MSLKCVIGLHTPSLVSVARNADGLQALCEGCGAPLSRGQEGRWRTAQPLVAARGDRGRA